MMQKIGYLTLLLIWVTGVKAQSGTGFVPSNFQGYYFSPQNLGYALPQTADFVQYGNTKMNYYNGLLDLEIPLIDYKDPVFELNTSLKYISDGFRPGRRPSIMGNNWVLNAGGAITRNVVGCPDDVRGYKGNNSTIHMMDGLLVAIRDGRFKSYSKEDLFNLNIPKVADDFPYRETEYDMAPDIFDFNFGRYKGRFMIDNSGNAKCLSGGEYKIDLSGMPAQAFTTTDAPAASYIVITTPDGCKYTFGGSTSYLEYNVPNNPDKLKKSPVQIVSWYLNSIVDVTGKQAVNFDYQNYLQRNKYHYFVRSGTGGMGWHYFMVNNVQQSTPISVGNLENEHFLMTDNLHTPVLKTIRINDIKINFEVGIYPVNFWGDTDGNDLLYLSAITMTDGYKVLRSCSFTYQRKGKYFFLDKVNLSAQDSNSPAYAFEYKLDRDLPDPLTTSTDHWGFWNGKYEMIVDTKIFLDSNLQSRKAVNTAVSDLTLLDKIVYPTGGEEKIAYEYNRYNSFRSKRTDQLLWDTNTSDNALACGGTRVKSLSMHDPATGKERRRTFDYTVPQGGRGSGVINELPRYDMPEEEIRYRVNGNGVNDYTYYDIRSYSASSNSLGRLNNISEYGIGYSDVTETFDDGSYACYHYSSFLDVPDDSALKGDVYFLLPDMPITQIWRSFNSTQLLDKALNYSANDLSEFRGKLLSKQHYNSKRKRVFSEEYSYNADEKASGYEVSITTRTGNFLANRVFTVPCRVTQEKHTDENGVVTLRNCEYNAQSMLKETETVNSNGDHIYVRYVYPGEYARLHYDQQYADLLRENRIEEPVAAIKYLRKAGEKERKIVDFIQTLYEPFKDCGIRKRSVLRFCASEPLPEDTDFDELHSMLYFIEAVEAYDQYDCYGNLMTYRKEDEKIFYLWGNKGKNLAAEIKGATYEEIKAALERTPEYFPTSGTLGQLKKMKERLVHASVTLYDYKPQVGVKYMSTPAGKESYFQFDPYGRFKKSFRKGEHGELQLLEFNQYHYAK